MATCSLGLLPISNMVSGIVLPGTAMTGCLATCAGLCQNSVLRVSMEGKTIDFETATIFGGSDAKKVHAIRNHFLLLPSLISYLCRQQYHYTKVRICAIPSPCGISFSRNNIFLSSCSTFLPCANHVAVHDGTNCARDLVRYSTFGLCLSIELHSRPDAHPDTQPLGCNSNSNNSNNESPNYYSNYSSSYKPYYYRYYGQTATNVGPQGGRHEESSVFHDGSNL
jgi:hypothetical protein